MVPNGADPKPSTNMVSRAEKGHGERSQPLRSAQKLECSRRDPRRRVASSIACTRLEVRNGRLRFRIRLVLAHLALRRGNRANCELIRTRQANLLRRCRRMEGEVADRYRITVDQVLLAGCGDRLLNREVDPSSEEKRWLAHRLGRVHADFVVRVAHEAHVELARAVVERWRLVGAWTLSEQTARRLDPCVLAIAPDELLDGRPAHALRERSLDLPNVQSRID
mmetsp:Transcript_27390/g.68050  ORF Transcript_27390/g.68050 Transcript_27390/m.68050 type:complete len:223 (+) Transcript_27390:304-972(+)